MLIQEKLDVLRKAPSLLRELLEEMPVDLLRIRRIPGKWSAHEHACHLTVAQKMIIERFERFKKETAPEFRPYLPGSTTPDDDLAKMDLKESLDAFEEDRLRLVRLLESYGPADWQKMGKHPQYKLFTPHIFLRHVMMHDHFHMYRIEEMWLTNDGYL